MSIQIMTQVWQRGPVDRSARMLLLAIADNANDRGEAFPSLALMGQKACMSKSTVIRTLQSLETAGWLTVEHRAAREDARGNLYVITLTRLGLAQAPITPRRKVGVMVTPNTASPKIGVTVTPKPALGVMVTPNCELAEVSKTTGRGVKTAIPPTPPFVGEPSGTVSTTPLPPASGGSEKLDPDARAAKIARLQSQLKTAPKSSGEYFAIAAELARLRREEPKPQARDGDRAAPAAIALPPKDAAPDELARWVMGCCGFVGDALRKRPLLAPALTHVIAAADEPARPERAAQMVAAWREYAQGTARWSPKNFFLQGHWQSPASWPRDTRMFDPCAPLAQRALA